MWQSEPLLCSTWAPPRATDVIKMSTLDLYFANVIVERMLVKTVQQRKEGQSVDDLITQVVIEAAQGGVEKIDSIRSQKRPYTINTSSTKVGSHCYNV